MKVYGEASARFVHMVTTKIREGTEVCTANLTIKETIGKVLKIVNKMI